MDCEQATRKLVKSEGDAVHTEGWIRVMREDLAPVFAGVPLAMLGLGEALERSLLLKDVAVGVPLAYPMVVCLDQLYANWRFGAKGGSGGRQVGYALLNIALALLAIVSAAGTFGLPLCDWGDEVFRLVICTVVLPSAVACSHLLTTSCNLIPGSISFADATTGGMVVDLMLALSPVAALGVFTAELEVWHHAVVACVLFSPLVFKTVRKRLFRPAKCSGGAKWWRWGMLCLVAVSLAMISSFIVVNSTDGISTTFLGYPIICGRGAREAVGRMESAGG